MKRLLLLVPTSTYRARAFVEAAKRLGVDVTLASEHPSSLSPQLPADLISLDFDNVDAACDTARRFASRFPVDAVVGVDDASVVCAAAVAEALGLPHNSLDSVLATRNKLTMRQTLSRDDVPIPAFRALSTLADPVRSGHSIDFPCVLKPLMMSASRGVIRANNVSEFVEAFREIGDIVKHPDAPKEPDSRNFLLVESYVPGWEVSVEAILAQGDLHFIAIFDKPDPLEGPYFPETIYVTPSRLPSSTQQRIQRVTAAAVRSLGLTDGPVHAELRGNDSAICVIEVAARSIGGYCSKVLRFERNQSLEDVILGNALDVTTFVPALVPGSAGVMMLQAPRAGTLREVRGVDAASAVPGMTEVLVSATIGDRVHPLPKGFLYVAFLFARGRDPRSVERTLRTAYGKLDIVIDPE